MKTLVFLIAAVVNSCYFQIAVVPASSICAWPGKPLRGFAFLQQDPKATHYPPGSLARIRCQDGYENVAQDDRARHYDLICVNNGEWKGPFQGCRDATVKLRSGAFDLSANPVRGSPCVSPPEPENGYSDQTNRQSGLVRSGMSINFGCNNHHFMKGSPRMTCSNGTWIGTAPVCQKSSQQLYSDSSIMCDALDLKDARPAQPNEVSTTAYYLNANFAVGTKIKYTCENGFKLKGFSEIVCLENGIWTGLVPSCELQRQVQCDPLLLPPTPQNAEIVDANYANRPYWPGSSVDYACRTGHYQQGSTQVFCEANGKWSANTLLCAVPTTTPTTTTTTRAPIVCPFIQENFLEGGVTARFVQHEDAPRGFAIPWDGSRYEFSCQSPDRILVGDEIAVCQQGRWVGKIARCAEKKPQCQPFETMLASTDTSKSSALVKMDAKMVVNGQVVKATDPANATLWEFSCPDTHSISGPRRMVCLDGVWVGGLPSCTVKVDICDMIPPPAEHMQLQHKGNKTAIYTCDAGYVMRGGDTATCVDQKWVWKDGRVPWCGEREKSCTLAGMAKRSDRSRKPTVKLNMSQKVWVCLDTILDVEGQNDLNVLANINTAASVQNNLKANIKS